LGKGESGPCGAIIKKKRKLEKYRGKQNKTPIHRIEVEGLQFEIKRPRKRLIQKAAGEKEKPERSTSLRRGLHGNV